MDSDMATNLTYHRAARSVWDKRGWSGVTIEERVGPWIVSLAGASLVIAGARQRSWRGVRWMVGGATLIGCAAAGLCNPRHAAVRWRHLSRPSHDRTTTELMDSFPASDAPSSSGVAVGAVLMWDS
jgi:hypothetical protein